MMAMTTTQIGGGGKNNGKMGPLEPITQTMIGQKHRKKILVVLLVWVSATLLVVAYWNQAEFNSALHRVSVQISSRYRIDSTNNTQLQRDINNTAEDEEWCKGFSDEPFHPSIVKYFRKKPTLSCQKSSVPNFLYVTEGGDYLKINKEKVKSLNVTVDYCKYASLKRRSDVSVTVSPLSKSFTDSISLPEDVEHIRGECYNKTTVVGLSYISVIRKNGTLEKILKKKYDAHVKKKKPKETLSILLIGIDGTSRLNFARQMPKTKSFVLDKMGGIEFYKLNKLGMNTFPNVVPLLTGHSENEVRKNWTRQEHLDKFDRKFIWNEAIRAGYRTSVILDRIIMTSFHYLKKGWNKPTFHYYNRPVVVKSEGDKSARKPSPFCIGDTHEVTLLYDYWLQLTKTFNSSQTQTTPYFGYSFFCHVTHHDGNRANIIDDIYLELFQKFMAQNSLNNTLIVFFSDHGTRFGNFRATFRGMLEDSNPFLFFIFPPWFEAKYPKIMTNFRKNQHRIMTHFNVHAMLKDILYFQGDDIAKRPPDKETRGTSLFQELPKKRTCEQAAIPIKYCNCRNFSTHGITPELKAGISKQLLNSVVAKTRRFRDKCVALTLNSTLSVMSLITPSNAVHFYQVTIKTSPGDAIYEATLGLNLKRKTYYVKGDIPRTTMYQGQADCISDARMRPFCYCNNLL